MGFLDWAIVCLYLSCIVAMSLRVGRGQVSQEDYYLGGRRIGSWAIALSILATQSSAISLLGTPSFVALKAGGGMIWLQYEFAVPLAMAFLIFFFIPVFYKLSITTIYEYLEERFGPTTRLAMALVFLLGRSLATGVSLLATAIVLSVPLGISLSDTLLLVGGIAILYTTIGGIKADIYSDIVQLVILWIGTLALVMSVLNALGGVSYEVVEAIPVKRAQIFDWSHHGMGDGKTYAFWPMLSGGFFLYLSYYGCDQSQAQRLLTASEPLVVQKALFLNGLLRFPLVLTQCILGLLLAVFVAQNPNFSKELLLVNPDFLVPSFLTSHVSVGLRGIIMAGLLAAAMSSLDSALNSLSAVTLRDFNRYFKKRNVVYHELFLARGLTIAWGIVCTLIGFSFSKSSSTVIELVNMAGSLFYGPVLGVFLLGILIPWTKERGVIAGLIFGVFGNFFLWRYFTGVSWLWWNPIGCLLTVISGCCISLFWENPKTTTYIRPTSAGKIFTLPNIYCLLLSVFFIFILVFTLWLEGLIGGAILLD